MSGNWRDELLRKPHRSNEFINYEWTEGPESEPDVTVQPPSPRPRSLINPPDAEDPRDLKPVNGTIYNPRRAKIRRAIYTTIAVLAVIAAITWVLAHAVYWAVDTFLLGPQ